MRPAHVVEIVTPKKYVLNGLWFGPKKPKRAIVFVHGLSASAFSMSHIVENLVNSDTAVMTFNNRGFEKIAEVKRDVGRNRKWIRAGAAHEVFTDSDDDLQGAMNFVRKQGVKSIYLAGHSTGCQKSIYWAGKHQGGRGVKGVILLAPVSDLAAEIKLRGTAKISRAVKAARALVARGKKHEILPSILWHEVLDAQRFLSLYTPDSVEEIFPYGQPKKTPRILRSASVPILAFWAEKDQFGYGIGRKVSDWFNLHMKDGDFLIVPSVKHSFRGAEKEIGETIHEWVKSL